MNRGLLDFVIKKPINMHGPLHGNNPPEVSL